MLDWFAKVTGKVLGGALAFMARLLIYAAIIWLAWNGLLPYLTGAPEIGFHHAIWIRMFMIILKSWIRGCIRPFNEK